MKTIKSLITLATVLGVAQVSLGFAPPRTKPKERIPVPAVEKNPVHKPGNPMDPMRVDGEAKKEDATKLSSGIETAKSLVCESGDNKVVINLNEPTVKTHATPTEADPEAVQQSLEVSRLSQVVIKSKDSSVKFESSLSTDPRVNGASYSMMNPTTEPVKQKLFIDTQDHKSAKLILWRDNSKDGERIEMLCHFYTGPVDADKLNIEKPLVEATKAALKLNGLPELKEEPLTPPPPALPENGEKEVSQNPVIVPISTFFSLGINAFRNRDALQKTVDAVRNSAIVGEMGNWWNNLPKAPVAPTPPVADDEAFLPEFTPEEARP